MAGKIEMESLSSCSIGSCSIDCPGACICAERTDGTCGCTCSPFTQDSINKLPKGPDIKLSLSITDSRINIAKTLNLLAPGCVYIEASENFAENVTVKENNKPISEVAESIGLVFRKGSS